MPSSVVAYCTLAWARSQEHRETLVHQMAALYKGSVTDVFLIRTANLDVSMFHTYLQVADWQTKQRERERETV